MQALSRQLRARRVVAAARPRRVVKLEAGSRVRSVRSHVGGPVPRSVRVLASLRVHVPCGTKGAKFCAPVARLDF